MQTKCQLILENEKATLRLGQKMGESLAEGTILLLNGELGAGKTTFVQGLGIGLGIREAIVSPTFTLVNEYHEGRIPLYHLDLYRLRSADVMELCLEQYWNGVDNPLGITAIEWAERLEHKPLAYLEITLQYQQSGRSATLTSHGAKPISFDIFQLNLTT